MNTCIKAVIFDLDGVITDTAEYHFLAWKRLADEEGIIFTRQDNEALRGVSRRESLRLLLKGKPVTEPEAQQMMDRKNGYYVEMLGQITPDDLLPGVADLLDQLRAAGVPCAIASASRNAQTVCERLGILDRITVLTDSSTVARQKPAPDLFRSAAALLNYPPADCLVVEDAAAGIEAGLAAGMACLALGPADRFAEIAQRRGSFARRDDLKGVTLDEIQSIRAWEEGWTLAQDDFDPATQRHMETVFTAGSGYFCSRGSFEEGYPNDHALTLAHGVFDDMPISMTELANLPNWLDFDLIVDGERFRLDWGQVLDFRRHMDLRRGILRRDVRWQSPSGAVLDLTFERFASYAREHIGAMRVLITAVNQPCRIEVETGINGHVANDDLLHWRHADQGVTDGAVWLRSETRHSGLTLAAAAVVTGTAGDAVPHSCPGQPRLAVGHDLGAAQTVQIDKLVSYATSRDPGADGDPVARALAALDGQTYDDLRAAQIAAWADLWDECDVIIEGDDEAQIAVRFYLFQLLSAAPQHDEFVSMGAKSLSGLGYRGHVFWDTEIFILPFFMFTQPEMARNMLMYRYHTLPGARNKAAANGYSGAQYAWESAATGDEVTPRWVPSFDGQGLVRIWTGDIEIHITSDVAYAIHQYWQATGDDAFLRDYGAEMILSGACFWGDRAEPETDESGQRRYALRDVIGPDEYHDHVDNNVYTNRMAQWHLQLAFATLDWLDAHAPEKAAALREDLDLSAARLAHWQDVIEHIIIHHDPDTGLLLQFDGFFARERIDPAVIAATDKSMQVVLGIEGANASQVLKQADAIMLLCLLRDEYDAKTWQTNWDTYMPITDHQYGSSLGPSFHAWAACEMDKPDEAYGHFMLAAKADLYDVRGNAGDGIHAASAGGIWQALVFGFAGLRLGAQGVTLNPRLPSHWTRLAFNVRIHGEKERIDIRKGGDGISA
ncbi:MAG TPA: beta-phosphoglucomutase [Aggregatilinea sp.]|uniref:beta-phosphoglucomutase n=1 Tax=Aggregatilinea sp. TaxID=2806333 RepID=UPI002B7561BF|nr:beta-phosphoglucomutase [Aggregatilinea sp.]HML24311.1 beta-phosphoglucomutase [Aggregatilinea sp.]